MRRFFAPLDDALFERLFQPLTSLLTYRFGLRRRPLACLCIDAATIGWIVARAGGLSRVIAEGDGASAALRLVLLLLGIGALISLRSLFRRIGDRTANPLRVAMQPHRAVILLLLAARVLHPANGSLHEVADLAMLLFTWAALYLGACSEPPPVRRSASGLVGAEA